MSWLCHHGIKGQKWGKRNGPPYPISPGDHSAAEKKAALTDKQKKVIKTTAVIIGGAALAVIGGITISKLASDRRVGIGRDALETIVGSGKIDLGPEIPNSGGFHKFANDATPTRDEIVAKAMVTNRAILFEDEDYEPCTNIFMQTVCQSQGINAVAGRPLLKSGNRVGDVVSCFQTYDPPLKDVSASAVNRDVNAVFRDKLKYPDGSYGFIAGGITANNNKVVHHMFRWDMKDGKPIFSNGVFGDSSIYIGKLTDYRDNNGLHKVSIMRVDDLELDWDEINNKDMVRPG